MPRGKEKHFPHWNSLLEDLGVVAVLTVNVRLAAPVGSNALAGGLVLVVQASPGVDAGLGVDVKHGLDVLAADEPDSGDGVVTEALESVEHLHDAESVLLDANGALHVSLDLVAHDEVLGVFVVVVELLEPDGPALLVEVGPEPVHGLEVVRGGVGVRALPVVEDEGRLGEEVERVLLLLLGGRSRGRSWGSLFLLVLLATTLLLLVLLVGVLGRGRGLGAVHDSSEHSSGGGDRGDVAEPAQRSGELGAEGAVEGELERVEELGSDDDVSERQALADEEGARQEVRLELGKGGREVLEGLLVGLEVERLPPELPVGGEDGRQLHVVGAPVDPGVHLAGLEERLAVETSLRARAGDVAGDRVALGDGAVRGRQHRHRVGRRALGVDFLDGHAHASNLGRDERLEGAEIACVSGELHCGGGGGTKKKKKKKKQKK